MRRIKKAKITHISLLARGATQLPVLYKSEDQVATFETLIKDEGFEELGELTAVVYAPELPDSHGDVASAEVIKSMAYDYAKRGGNLDVTHDFDDLPKDAAFVAESFIIQKGDPRFAEMRDYSGNPVDVTGGWATVIKIDDPGLRRLYREGKWNGVSMAGPAVVEPEASTAESVVAKMAGLLGLETNDKEEIDMDEAKLAGLLKEQNAPVIDAITKLAEALTPKKEEETEGKVVEKSEETDDEIKFEGDPTNPKDLKKHAAKLKKAQLLKSGDLNDPEKLAALIEESASDEETDDAEETEVEKGEDPKIVELEKQIAKLKKNAGKSKAGGGETKLTKAEEARASGKRMASLINSRRERKRPQLLSHAG